MPTKPATHRTISAPRCQQSHVTVELRAWPGRISARTSVRNVTGDGKAKQSSPARSDYQSEYSGTSNRQRMTGTVSTRRHWLRMRSGGNQARSRHWDVMGVGRGWLSTPTLPGSATPGRGSHHECAATLPSWQRTASTPKPAR